MVPIKVRLLIFLSTAFPLSVARAARVQSLESNDPRWTEDSSLANAALPAKIKQRIWHELGGDENPPEVKQEELEYTKILPFNIGTHGQRRKLLRVWAGGELCSATSNRPILIVDANAGELLLNGFGVDMEFRKTHHAGAPDTYTVAHENCCSGEWEVYRYDGEHYRLYKSKEFTTDPR